MTKRRMFLVGALVAVVAYLVVTSVAGFFKKDTWMATYYPDPINLLVSESAIDLESLEACREWVESKAMSYDDDDYDYECGRNCEPFDESLGIFEPYVCEETLG